MEAHNFERPGKGESPLNLRPYQARAVDFLAARHGPAGRALCVCPAGGGKTIIGAAALAKVAQPWDRVGWACNTREQVQQGQAALDRAGVQAWVKCVAGISREDTAGLDFLVVDECFQGNTLIDGVPISQIKAGDYVFSFNHRNGTVEKRKVLDIFKRRYANKLIRLTSSSGRNLACTEGHPIFVLGYGYITAGRIAELLRMRGQNTAQAKQAQKAPFQILREQMRDDSSRADCSVAARPTFVQFLRKARSLRAEVRPLGSYANRASVLLKSMLKGIRAEVIIGNHAKNKPEPVKNTKHEDDFGQPYAESENGRKGAACPCRSDFSLEGRKRKDYGATREAARGNGASNGIPNQDGGRGRCLASLLLQGRFSGTGCEAVNRGGRQLSQNEKMAILRREEDGSLSFDWLDGCEIYEPRSGPRPEWVREQDTVYNLHVEGNENYFAEGVLVHNCHHIPANSWSLIADACLGTIWGLTATPKSPDPERNFWFARFWGAGNTITIPRSEVMEGGHLAAGQVRILDLDTPGEFDEAIKGASEIEALRMYRRFPYLDHAELLRRAKWRSTLEMLIENPARNAAVVETALREIGEGQSVLVLVAEIDQGTRFAEQIPGAVLAHSKMGAKKRRAAIDAFRDGSLRCLIATSLADEGLDVPRASVLILATAGRSGAKIEQRTGRVMRPHEGKGVGLVYDFADRGASMAHSQFLARRAVYRKLGYAIL